MGQLGPLLATAAWEQKHAPLVGFMLHLGDATVEPLQYPKPPRPQARERTFKPSESWDKAN